MSRDYESALGGIIFSFADDAVWASWSSKEGRIELGSAEHVIYMMRDFLAQCDLGERLALRKAAND